MLLIWDNVFIYSNYFPGREWKMCTGYNQRHINAAALVLNQIGRHELYSVPLIFFQGTGDALVPTLAFFRKIYSFLKSIAHQRQRRDVFQGDERNGGRLPETHARAEALWCSVVPRMTGFDFYMKVYQKKISDKVIKSSLLLVSSKKSNAGNLFEALSSEFVQPSSIWERGNWVKLGLEIKGKYS